jgi:glycosyltransferase involved in cell wall biosynthesis
MTPKVSVIIPTYNQSSYIEKAIESAIAQTYANLEIVVADDCSSDSTEQVIRRFQENEKFKYFRNPHNLGRVGNYKNALENYATGEWVVNLDGDDFFCDDNFISEVVDIIHSHGDQNIVFVQGGQYISKQGRLILDNPHIPSDTLLIDGNEYFLNFHRFKHFSHLSTVFDRRKAIEIDFYRLDIASSDIESFLRLALHGKVVLVKKPYGVWVHHTSNFSQNLTLKSARANYKYITSAYQYARERGLDRMALFKWRLRQQASLLRQQGSYFVKKYSGLYSVGVSAAYSILS